MYSCLPSPDDPEEIILDRFFLFLILQILFSLFSNLDLIHYLILNQTDISFKISKKLFFVLTVSVITTIQFKFIENKKFGEKSA